MGCPPTTDPGSSPRLLLYSQSRKNQSDEHDGGEDRFSATDSHSWYVHCTIAHTDLAFLDPGLGSKEIPTLDNFGVVATLEK